MVKAVLQVLDSILPNNPIPDANNIVTIDYSITTNEMPSNPTFATIPFCSETGERVCYRITILPELCPIDPYDCVESWSPKQIDCQYTASGLNIIELEMDFDFIYF